MKEIAIIGGGWVGCSTALELRKKGFKVTIFEKSADIFEGESGKFGLRLHAGPHYPRSANTRKSCQDGLIDFRNVYPELVIKNAHSIYGLGIKDIDGQPSKVDPETFRSVCHELESCQEIAPDAWGYEGLHNAFDMDEPSLAVGSRLRDSFKKYLLDAGVSVVCKYEVKDVQKGDGQFIVNDYPDKFDHVVNATYYQDILPNQPLPASVEAVYQPCLTLRYKEKIASHAPSSFTVMDGRFVCLMPREDTLASDVSRKREYTLYHAKYTILDTFNTPQLAHEFLETLQKDEAKYNELIEKWRPQWEADIKRFYPAFEGRFDFVGTNTGVASKLKTEKDFRTAVTLKNQENGMIYVFSGKVNNVLDAAAEILQLIETPDKDLVYEDGFYYLPNGEFSKSRNEIIEKPLDNNNTCELHTIQELGSLSQFLPHDLKFTPKPRMRFN